MFFFLSLSLFISLSLSTPLPALQTSSAVSQPAGEKFLCLVYWIFQPPGAFWQTLILLFLLTSLLGLCTGVSRTQRWAVRNHWASCLTWPYDFQLPHFPLSSPSYLSPFFLSWHSALQLCIFYKGTVWNREAVWLGKLMKIKCSVKSKSNPDVYTA